MIISHKHKFIFIKTEKTAGTSLEIALSKFCGPDDIITPITPNDEAMRTQLGYRGPQNFKIPFRNYSSFDLMWALHCRQRIAFYNHCDAVFIKKHINEDIWNNYYKFSFERNPWSKIISWYYWKYQTESRPILSELILSGQANNVQGFNLYTINSEVVVDKVYLFENLQEALLDIETKLDLPEPLIMPQAKGKLRKDRRDYSEILTLDEREKIAKVYAREIMHFGYSF